MAAKKKSAKKTNRSKSKPVKKAAKKPAPGFSFAAYGDSRTMMYLPPKEAQKEEAIKLMPRADVVLTDFHMPGGNGDEIISHAGNDLPVVVLSATLPAWVAAPARMACSSISRTYSSSSMIRM